MCGRIIGYQVGSTDAFNSGSHFTIDQAYIDGVSVTYGTPRKHIWTFASGISETNVRPETSCPCAFAGPPQPPSFVRNNYFCESGNPLTAFEDTDVLDILMIHSGMGRDVRVSVAAMLTLLLGSVLSFLRKRTNLLKYESLDLTSSPGPMKTLQLCCWKYTCSDKIRVP